ncbi:MAG: methyltransferase domain-containing protein [Gammaproteobacteria bacterium]|nr:methyltransferase domain-containing protein [Gammaproteobacteria bacterium]
MSLEEREQPYSTAAGSLKAERRRRLRAWFRTRPGAWVLEEEVAALGQVLPDLFGYHLLQVESLDGVDLLEDSRVQNAMIMGVGTPPSHLRHSFFRGIPKALPVASESIDVVVLPHVLEFEDHPHQALREAERVLVPEGHLVVTGFNPWSLMGLRRLFDRRRGSAPWNGDFISASRLKDWLALLGFDVIVTDSCFYRPPLSQPALMDRLRFLDGVGRRLWGMGGGIYVMVARKRVVAVTPLKPRWRPERRLLPSGLGAPTTRRAARVVHHG